MFFSPFFRKAVVFAGLVAASSASFGQLVIQVGFAPPMLPVYVQPICPGDGYIWTPGYWAYGPEGYYWVPGTWVLAPQRGFLWTPAFWGWEGGFYHFHHGYWGPHIGFYGGINYGFGYFGTGYEGGEWRGDRFFYNTRVGNFGGAHVTNVYEHNVTIINNNYNRVSYNGGNGGVPVRPRPQELQAEHERHVDPTPVQQQHFQAAERDRGQLATVNGGRPQVQAARTPQEFTQRVNTLPQQQRVAPGAPGERFHPNPQQSGQPGQQPVTQNGAQNGVQNGVQNGAQPGGQPASQIRRPNADAPQNRMQQGVPRQPNNNQPQAQPQNQQRPLDQPQRPLAQPQRPLAQPQQPRQPDQSRPQRPEPQPQPQPQQQRQMEQPRPQPQPQQRQMEQPRQQPQPQPRPQEQQRPQQTDRPREERPR